jgi:excisionase family DNA binding protein
MYPSAESRSVVKWIVGWRIMSRFLNVRQTAEKLQMTERVVRQHLRNGTLPGYKSGRVWHVLESDLKSWTRSQPRVFVSARGLLKQYPGSLSSADVIADKRAEVLLEDRNE